MILHRLESYAYHCFFCMFFLKKRRNILPVFLTWTCAVGSSRATSAAASLTDIYAAAVVPAAEVLATGERKLRCWQRVHRGPQVSVFVLLHFHVFHVVLCVARAC